MNLSSPHLRGSLLTAAGVLVLTPDGLLVRLISADVWTLLAWRGFFFATAIFGFYTLKYGKGVIIRTMAMGRMGVIAGFFFGGSTIFFVQSLNNTSVANTLVIIATAPLFAALISHIFLKEKVEPSTWIAILVSSGGIAFIFKESLSSDYLLGDIFALACAICIASQITTVRRARHIDMVPSLGLGSLVVASIAFFSATSIKISTTDLSLLMLLGLVVLPIAFGLITIGPRYIPAAEVSLLMLLETFLGPIWVWLVIGEHPSINTIIGGGLVLLTLAGHTLYNARRKRTA